MPKELMLKQKLVTCNWIASVGYAEKEIKL